MTEVVWPTGLSPRIITMQLINQTRSMNQSLSGIQQVNSSLAQRWRLTLDFNTLRRAEVLSYRAMMASLEGRANTIRVPVWDKRLEPKWYPTPSADVVSSSLTLRSAATGTKSQSTVVVDQRPLRDSVWPGHYVGIEGDVYMVTGRTFDGSGVCTLTVQPRLRQTFTDADMTLRPTLHCRLAGDEIGDLPLDLGLRGAPALDLVEVL